MQEGHPDVKNLPKTPNEIQVRKKYAGSDVARSKKVRAFVPKPRRKCKVGEGWVWFEDWFGKCRNDGR
jgi:hypothetical protein